MAVRRVLVRLEQARSTRRCLVIKPHATTRGQKTKAHVKYDMRFFLAVRTLLHLRAVLC